MVRESRGRREDHSAGVTGAIQQQLDEKPHPVRSEGGATERHCVLCKEEGRENETARDMVTIRLRSGGEARKVAVCSAHLKSLGEATSSSYVVDDQPRGFPNRGSARPRSYVPGQRKDGDIGRTMRKAERYGRTQRGRLGQ